MAVAACVIGVAVMFEEDIFVYLKPSCDLCLGTHFCEGHKIVLVA